MLLHAGISIDQLAHVITTKNQSVLGHTLENQKQASQNQTGKEADHKSTVNQNLEVATVN